MKNATVLAAALAATHTVAALSLDYLHNEYETSWRLHYPQCSMCWLGIESGDKFLYVARLNEQIRACFLTVRHTIHGDDLMPCVVHLPMARPQAPPRRPPLL